MCKNRMDGKKADSKIPDPDPDRCAFYLPRKRRHCKTIPGTGKRFCVEHSHLSGEDNARKRIPCPLDSKHSCYEDQLEKHLKKCNSREKPQPDYYEKKINSGSLLETDNEDDLKVTVVSCSYEELMELIKKVQEIYAGLNLELQKEILVHKALKEEVEKPSNGPAAQKHIQQQASLLGHIEKLELLHDKTCFIEFGAGKGHMSHWIQQALPESKNSQFLLIERSGVRYKLDNLHKGDEQGPSFERLRMDIAHLNLGKLKCLQDNPMPVVGVGKHLCGAATDLTLRCLLKTLSPQKHLKIPTSSDDTAEKMTTQEDNGSSYTDETKTNHKQTSWAAGVVIALCCHHRCDWQSYVGKEWFTERGLTGRDFQLMSSMSSWATCANPFTQSDNKDSKTEEEEPYFHSRYGHITPEEREEIGKQCKRLIDMGRVKYLEKHDLKSNLKVYIDSSLSLENVVLLSSRNNIL